MINDMLITKERYCLFLYNINAYKRETIVIISMRSDVQDISLCLF